MLRDEVADFVCGRLWFTQKGEGHLRYIHLGLAKSFCNLIEYVEINTFRYVRLFAIPVSFHFVLFP